MAQRGTAGLDGHYAREHLTDAILAGLRAAGKDPEVLTVDDLKPVDQIHTLGASATRELLQMAGITARMHVLDVGGGIGGPARQLAVETGCSVVVLDLTEDYVRAGEALTARSGLTDLVTFQHGDATAIPFVGASFDIAWTQHSTMNIPDKVELYREIHRVLVRGGRLAMHEIMAGPAGPPHFPTGWAPDPSLSFLLPPEEMRALIRRCGFRELAWHDTTPRVREAFAQLGANPPAPSALSPALVFGTTAAEIAANSRRNVAEGRVVVIQAVFERT